MAGWLAPGWWINHSVSLPVCWWYIFHEVLKAPCPCKLVVSKKCQQRSGLRSRAGFSQLLVDQDELLKRRAHVQDAARRTKSSAWWALQRSDLQWAEPVTCIRPFMSASVSLLSVNCCLLSVIGCLPSCEWRHYWLILAVKCRRGCTFSSRPDVSSGLCNICDCLRYSWGNLHIFFWDCSTCTAGSYFIVCLYRAFVVFHSRKMSRPSCWLSLDVFHSPLILIQFLMFHHFVLVLSGNLDMHSQTFISHDFSILLCLIS